MPASDFRVQKFEVIVPAAEGTTLVPIPIPIDITRTRVMLGSPGFNLIPIGAEFPRDDVSPNDTMSGIFIGDSTTLVISTSATKQFVGIVSFYLLEYIGPAGGVNEFTVIRGVSTVAGGLGNIFDKTGLDPTQCQKITSMVTGCFQTPPGSTSEYGLDLSPKIVQTFNPDIDNLIAHFIQCRDDSLISREVYWEVTDWSGSNWSIVRPPFGAITANQSDAVRISTVPKTVQAIDDVGDWGSTFIEAQRSGLAGENNGSTRICHVFPHSNATNTMSLYVRTGALANAALVFACISNPEIKVAHSGQFLRALPTPTPYVNASANPAPLRWESGSEIVETIRGDAVIDGPQDRVASIFMGSKGNYLDGLDAISAMYDAETSQIIYRRGLIGGGGWNNYNQIIQFGLDAKDDVALSGSVIDRPILTINFER